MADARQKELKTSVEKPQSVSQMEFIGCTISDWLIRMGRHLLSKAEYQAL